MDDLKIKIKNAETKQCFNTVCDADIKIRYLSLSYSYIIDLIISDRTGRDRGKRGVFF